MEGLLGTSCREESSNPRTQLRPGRGAEEPPIKPAPSISRKTNVIEPPLPDCVLIIRNQANKDEPEFQKVTSPHSTTTTRSSVARPNPLDPRAPNLRGCKKEKAPLSGLLLLVGLDHTHTAAMTSAGIVQAVAKVAVKQWWGEKKMQRTLCFCLLPPQLMNNLSPGCHHAVFIGNTGLFVGKRKKKKDLPLPRIVAAGRSS